MNYTSKLYLKNACGLLKRLHVGKTNVYSTKLKLGTEPTTIKCPMISRGTVAKNGYTLNMLRLKDGLTAGHALSIGTHLQITPNTHCSTNNRIYTVFIQFNVLSVQMHYKQLKTKQHKTT